MGSRVKWTGDKEIDRRLVEYQKKIHATVKQVAQYWGAVFEAYAKENASWTDQTANARQSLHTFIEELSQDTVKLYLSHGVEYGIYLETKYQGRYAIIWPTIERHLPEIRAMLQGIFR